jgi:hypothetical protein
MRTIRELGLPGRAVTALTGAGITGADELALLTRQELAAIAGLGPGTIAAIRLVVPEPAADPEQESPAAPAIPSFDSLRAPRRRSAVDLLVPGAPPPASEPVREPAPRPVPSAAPRAPEYADLWRLGVRVVRWSVRQPVHLLHRLLGGRA